MVETTAMNNFRKILSLKVEPNDPARRGTLASSEVWFGPRARYSIAAVHTRFDSVQFFVWDRENDRVVIRQTETLASAVEGLI